MAVKIAFWVLSFYTLVLLIRALRHYLRSVGETEQISFAGGQQGEMKKSPGVNRGIWIGAAAVIAVVVVWVCFRHSGAHAVSVIGGADGPTSVFLAGKVGDPQFVIDLFITLVNLGFLVLAAYVLILMIRALKKYLQEL